LALWLCVSPTTAKEQLYDIDELEPVTATSAAAALLKRPVFGGPRTARSIAADLRGLAAGDSVVCLIDPQGLITAITSNAGTVIGPACERAAELTLRLADIIMPEDPASFETRLRHHVEQQYTARLRVRCRGTGTAPRWFDIECRSMLDVPEVRGVIVELHDVTAHADQDALRTVVASAFATMTDSVIVTDSAGVIQWVNRAFETVTGYASIDVVGRSPSILKSGTHRPDFFANLWEVLRSGQPFAADIVNRRRDGSLYHEDVTITPVFDSAGVITNYVSVARDITARKALELHLEDRAYFDILTGVANQRLLQERSKQILALARRHGKTAALLHIDIHRLRSLNQVHGRDAGDSVLRSIADRLKQGLRESDTLARLPGDEFLVLLSEVSEDESTARVVRRLKESLTRPYRIGEQTLTVEAHVGVALYPQDATTFDELQECAELAMERARVSTGPFEFYRRELSELTQQKLSLEDDLGWAWDHDQFVLHYQPIVATSSGEVVGAEALARGSMVGLEALARWPHLERGMMSPAYFIPLAERTGRIIALDRWAIATAVKQGSAWAAQGWNGWVSVNLSARSLHDSELPGYVQRTLEAQNLAAKHLVIEITESAAMRDPAATAAVLRALKEIGVIIAVDDFGIGHSSLAYLKHFPVDLLKLDSSFIADLGTDTKDEQLLEIMIGLAHRIGARVVAEGVERQEQMDWLTAAGCDFIQGYLVGKPTAPDTITAEKITPTA
jgi:diguanylate cyclase (GGDEF)-like protein/PAS domain S-box-containing protein